MIQTGTNNILPTNFTINIYTPPILQTEAYHDLPQLCNIHQLLLVH
jgi:hypothetical protein